MREGEEPRRRRSRRERQRDRRRAIEAQGATAGAAPSDEGASPREEPSVESLVEGVPVGQPDTASSTVETHAFGVPPSEPRLPEHVRAPETVAAKASAPSADGEPEPVARVFAEATTIPEALEPVPAPPPVVEREPEPEPFPASPAASAVPSPAPSTVAVDTRVSLSEAGLELVETDPSKAASTQPEAEPVKLGRPRPERQKPVEEALVQVETQK